MTAADLSRPRLARLLAEARPDRDALVRLAGELTAFAPRLAEAPTERPLLAVVAVDLHDYYTALETLFERTARLLDGDVPKGPDWHRDLLVQMAADLPPVRGPVIAAVDRPWLESLRGFRHFFRHAYAVQLEAHRLLEHATAVQAGHPGLLGRVDGLVAHVEAVRNSLVT